MVILSGESLQVQYENVFTQNYSHYVQFAQQDVDTLHDVFLKIRARFENSIFTGKTITEILDKLKGYTKSAIYNTFLTTQRLKKHTVNPDDCSTQLENKLLENENLNADNESIVQQNEYITLKLFEYLKRNYTEEDNYVFRVYFLFDENKKITYAELSTITGYSISKCCTIIQKIKEDLRQNLINYINNG